MARRLAETDGTAAASEGLGAGFLRGNAAAQSCVEVEEEDEEDGYEDGFNRGEADVTDGGDPADFVAGTHDGEDPRSSHAVLLP